LKKENSHDRPFAQRRKDLEALCRRFHVRRLELFGSAASSQDRPGESDLDFLVSLIRFPRVLTRIAYFGLLKPCSRFLAGPWTWLSARDQKFPTSASPSS